MGKFIGIDAPNDKKIFRQEIYQRICSENREASQWNLADLDILTHAMAKKEQP